MEQTLIAQDPVDVTVGRRVLDPCCGGRMMWLNKQHPDVVFGDRRSETLTVTDRSHGNLSGTRTLRIEPDTLAGCPSCKGCSDGFDLLCDEDGCIQEAHCGWPTGDKTDKWGGYRNTCGQHREPHNAG